MLKHSRSMGVVMSVLFVMQPVHSAYEWVKSDGFKNGVFIASFLGISYLSYCLGADWAATKIDTLSNEKKNLEKENELMARRITFCESQGIKIKDTKDRLGGKKIELDTSEYFLKTIGALFVGATFKYSKKILSTVDKVKFADNQITLKEIGFIVTKKTDSEENTLFPSLITKEETKWIDQMGNCKLTFEGLD